MVHHGIKLREVDDAIAVHTWHLWINQSNQGLQGFEGRSGKKSIRSWHEWGDMENILWLVVSTHLKIISQIGNPPQIGVKIKNI